MPECLKEALARLSIEERDLVYEFLCLIGQARELAVDEVLTYLEELGDK
jgi:hypothetical protein